MAADPNTGLGPPPIQSPITIETGDQFGAPYSSRKPPSQRDLSQSWVEWVKSVAKAVPESADPPIDTPIIEEQDRSAVPTGDLTVPWAAWFNQLSATVTELMNGNNGGDQITY